jgi:Abortive infection alpha
MAPQKGSSRRVQAASGIKAKAEIIASARYEIRKTISKQIPEDVTRAKASAWLTILSPITQWAGLKGDLLAYKRELLRIQQEETLAAILHRAAPALAKLEQPIAPVPVKSLVPFLEAASLEEPDSEFVKLWANLLISSAEHYNSDNVYYVKLISQMSSRQARLFETIIGPKEPAGVRVSLEGIFCEFKHGFLLDLIKLSFGRVRKKPKTLDESWSSRPAGATKHGRQARPKTADPSPNQRPQLPAHLPQFCIGDLALSGGPPHAPVQTFDLVGQHNAPGLAGESDLERISFDPRGHRTANHKPGLAVITRRTEHHRGPMACLFMSGLRIEFQPHHIPRIRHKVRPPHQNSRPTDGPVSTGS